MIRFKWLYLIVYIYLVLPLVIFCLGWIRTPLNLLFAGLICFVSFRILKGIFNNAENDAGIHLRSLIFPILLLGIWVFFSGIGGFTFQNTDFNARNAIFRDLINQTWPVVYSPIQSNNMLPGYSQVMLVYYFGYWLPAALIGKLAGWKAANIFLYFWSWLATILVLMLLVKKLKKTPYLPTLLMIFFSGMDILGEVVSAGINSRFENTNLLPYFWLPIQHLEWWAGNMQFSSFTTQLYWVSNQALPAWVCMALLVNGIDRRHIAFIWALCFFFAPLPAIGFFPFVVMEIFKKEAISQLPESNRTTIFHKIRTGIHRAWEQTLQTLSLENLL
ncbi:MAG TPA: hypothetical protein VFM18_10130, partial [Methanosarcina sp.]|nr:hypothetical protein [Methanosarcina sp.]